MKRFAVVLQLATAAEQRKVDGSLSPAVDPRRLGSRAKRRRLARFGRTGLGRQRTNRRIGAASGLCRDTG